MVSKFSRLLSWVIFSMVTMGGMMEEVALKIGKSHVMECYRKHKDEIDCPFGPRFCQSSRALAPASSHHGGGNILRGHVHDTVNYCKYVNQCIRLRRKV